ncbi:unnamed protein product [Peronospora belbahrii]|uniref:Mos1 transposase HTH domain-containing protein n=1 Tax=Peronospora belbahrii TaxID=622444 RepID=A0ABN8CVY8_9STRA|nr:unnamed protein product [Peronospora belbahrii]
MKARLHAFYAKHNPGNDQNIAEIVRKFTGREHILCAKLFRKYGEAPDLMSMEGSNDQIEVTTTENAGLVAKVEYQRGFKPYVMPTPTDSFLDLRSTNFDAIQALQSSEKLLKLPVTTAYPLDNIQKCRHLLPDSDPNRQHLAIRPKKAISSVAEVNATALVKKARIATAFPSLFEQLADTYLDGPFCVLRRCFFERMRVVVVIRRVNSNLSRLGRMNDFSKKCGKVNVLLVMLCSQQQTDTGTDTYLEVLEVHNTNLKDHMHGTHHSIVMDFSCS